MKHNRSSSLGVVIRCVTLLAIAFSIGVTFYTHIILKDYEILSNPEGPDTSDYFE